MKKKVPAWQVVLEACAPLLSARSLGRMTDEEKKDRARAVLAQVNCRWGGDYHEVIPPDKSTDVVGAVITAFSNIADHLPQAVTDFAVQELGCEGVEGILGGLNGEWMLMECERCGMSHIATSDLLKAHAPRQVSEAPPWIKRLAQLPVIGGLFGQAYERGGVVACEVRVAGDPDDPRVKRLAALMAQGPEAAAAVLEEIMGSHPETTEDQEGLEHAAEESADAERAGDKYPPNTVGIHAGD